MNKLTKIQYPIVEAMTLYGGTIEDTGNGSGVGAGTGIEKRGKAYTFYDSQGYPGSEGTSGCIHELHECELHAFDLRYRNSKRAS